MHAIKEAFDTMAYVGGVLFFVMLMLGCALYTYTHFYDDPKDGRKNEDYKPYDWEDME